MVPCGLVLDAKQTLLSRGCARAKEEERMMEALTRCTRRVITFHPSTYQPLLKRHYAVIPREHLAYKQTTPLPIDPPSPLKTHPTHLVELSSQLQYPLPHSKIEFTPEDYSPPKGKTEGLPFYFHRTPSNKLPIYSDFKVQGTKKVFTVVRKFDGDIKVLLSIIFMHSLPLNTRMQPAQRKAQHNTQTHETTQHCIIYHYMK